LPITILMDEITEINTNVETYYSKNKEKVDLRASRKVQCSKCLKILQFRCINAHKKVKKCERDYQKRMVHVNAKLIEGMEVINV